MTDHDDNLSLKATSLIWLGIIATVVAVWWLI